MNEAEGKQVILEFSDCLFGVHAASEGEAEIIRAGFRKITEENDRLKARVEKYEVALKLIADYSCHKDSDISGEGCDCAEDMAKNWRMNWSHAMEDKYSPIPGEMDTIDCLRKERDELRAEVRQLKAVQGSNFRQVLEGQKKISSQSQQMESLKLSVRRSEATIGELVEMAKEMVAGLQIGNANTSFYEEKIRSVEQSK